MKYIAVFDDEMLSHFRTDDYDTTLVLTDNQNCTRGIKLLPLAKPLVANEEGIALYLTQEHIDCLLDYERQKSLERVLDSFKLEDGFEDKIKDRCLYSFAERFNRGDKWAATDEET